MAEASNDEQTSQDIEEESEEREMQSEDEASGSEEEDEDESSADDRENEAEIQRLEEQLSINVFDYNCHVDLIKLLRKEGKLYRLRKARQRMSELFPLTEEIWLDWLKDEIRLTEDESGREKICELFESAVKDYVCPDVWLEYGQYSIGGMAGAGGVEHVRAVFERGLTAVGLHMTKGSSVWTAYREFESALLSASQPPPGSVPSQEQQEALSVQQERVHTLFRRQLAVPLMDMEETYGEYSDWSEDGVPEVVTQQYRRALRLMEKYRPHEEALMDAEPPRLAEYEAYIDVEMKEGDPARVQIIYERALADNCLVPDLWTRFTLYLDRQLKMKDLVLSAHHRAVRNCPWTMTLWRGFLLALERHGAEHHTLTEVFEKALSAGFIQATDYVEIWQSYLDYLRRRVDFGAEGSGELEELRAAFTRCLDYLKSDVEERFTDSGDLSCAVLQVWAGIEASRCKNMQKARELWDRVMTKGNGRYANMWLEYYQLERSCGDAAHCRKVLHRAVQSTSDYPEHVCDVLLGFERVEGSLEDWDVAVLKTQSRLQRVNEQRARAAEKEANFTRQEEEKAEHRKKAQADKKALKKSQRPNRTGDKRKGGDETWEDTDQPSKRLRAEEELVDTECGRHAPPGFHQRRQPDPPPEQRDDDCSVFVSNLAFSLPEPQERLRSLFQACGSVRHVRPVFTAGGAFRGYGYVQFQDRQAAQAALKLDRQELDKRPMFVSPCVDKHKNPDFKVFKYETSLEKHKVFVSGLPYSCGAERLRELFQEHGPIKAVRLVTNRAGKPKGLAYVEYEHEAQASQAVLKMNGTTVENFTISVAISNPPSRRSSDAAAPSAVPRRPPPGARGKGRSQVCLLPRALSRNSAPATKAANGTASDTQATPLSNADFARMLLRK